MQFSRAAAALTLLSLVLSLSGSSRADVRPNVLLICIDDMRPQTRAYGHEIMITPNLDRLAAQSRLFTRHFVQVPTCGSSRACLLTGKNPRTQPEIDNHHFGERLFGRPEPTHPETLIHHFKRHGYRTIGAGKISHQETGWRVDPESGDRAHELPHSWREYLDDTGSRWGAQPQLHTFAYGKTREKDRMPPYECLELEDADYPDGRLAERAVDKLDEVAASEQPFLLAVGFFKPHLPFAAPKKYWDLYDRDAIAISSNPDSPRDVDPVFLHDSGECFRNYPGGDETGGAGKRLSDDYARKLVHGYYAAVSYMDAQLGKVLDRLERTGLDKNTVVVAWGDHGWHLGDHTIWGKHSGFERALKSLLLIKTPGQPRPGEATDALVATIDLYPTLCDLAGLPYPDGLDGRSLAGVVADPALPGKQHVLSFWRKSLSVRTDRWRMTVHHNGQRESAMLFDHHADPHETRNALAEHPEVAAELRSLLGSENRGFLPELDSGASRRE